MKTKDIKSLRRTINKAFNHDVNNTTDDDETFLESIVPLKSFVDTNTFKNKDVLYTINPDGKKSTTPTTLTPYFYVTRNKKEIIPTLFALWMNPNLLKIKMWTATAVSSKLIKKPPADLFLPGIAVPRNNSTGSIVVPWKRGELCSLFVFGNPLPFAIGRTFCSSEEAEKNGMVGIACTILHYFGDELWKMSPLTIPAGFHLQDRIDRTLPITAPEKEATTTQEGNSQTSHEDEEDETKEDEDEKDDEMDERKEFGERKEEDPNNTKEMDELMILTLLLSLSAINIKHDLPILASTFVSKYYVRASKSINQNLDINVKKSSWKKYSIFLQFISDTESLLTLKDDQKGNLSIVSFDKSVPLFRSFNSSLYDDDVISQNENQKNNIPGIKNYGNGHLQIIHYYKPRNVSSAQKEQVKQLFLNYGTMFLKNKKGKTILLYSREEIVSAISNYAKKNADLNKTSPNLNETKSSSTNTTLNPSAPKNVSSGHGMVVLDPLLCDLLFSPPYPVSVTKKQLSKACLKSMEVYHIVVRGTSWKKHTSSVLAKKGSGPPPIEIYTERNKQRGDKFLTHVRHLEGFHIDPELLVANGRGNILFAAKTMSQKDMKKPKNDTSKELLINGKVGSKVVKFLENVVGIPKKYIQQSKKKGI